MKISELNNKVKVIKVNNINELTPTQINLIVSRQNELEEGILGGRLGDGRDYVIWSFGGYRNFWEVNVWDYLGIKVEPNELSLTSVNKDLKRNEETN